MQPAKPGLPGLEDEPAVLDERHQFVAGLEVEFAAQRGRDLPVQGQMP